MRSWSFEVGLSGSRVLLNVYTISGAWKAHFVTSKYIGQDNRWREGCDFPGHRGAWPFSMALAHSTCSGNIGGSNYFLKKVLVGTSLVVQWLRVRLPTQGMKVPSLVGEPRSHMPQNQKNKNMKNRSSIVADSIKTLQMAHIIKKSLKKDLVGYLFYIQ